MQYKQIGYCIICDECGSDVVVFVSNEFHLLLNWIKELPFDLFMCSIVDWNAVAFKISTNKSVAECHDVMFEINKNLNFEQVVAFCTFKQLHLVKQIQRFNWRAEIRHSKTHAKLHRVILRCIALRTLTT